MRIKDEVVLEVWQLGACERSFSTTYMLAYLATAAADREAQPIVLLIRDVLMLDNTSRPPTCCLGGFSVVSNGSSLRPSKLTGGFTSWLASSNRKTATIIGAIYSSVELMSAAIVFGPQGVVERALESLAGQRQQDSVGDVISFLLFPL